MKIKTGFNLLPACYMVMLTIFCVFAWNSANTTKKNIDTLIEGSISSQSYLERAYHHVVIAAQYLQMMTYYADALDYVDVSRNEFESFERSYAAYFNNEDAQEKLQNIQKEAKLTWDAIEKSVQDIKKGGKLSNDVARAVVSFGARMEDIRAVYLLEYNRVTFEMQQQRKVEMIAYCIGMLFLIVMSFFVFRAMRKHCFMPMTKLSEHLEKMAQGDFSVPLRDHTRNELGVIYDSVRKMQNNVSAIIHEVHKGIGEVSKNSELLSNGSADLSVRTEQQSAALGETASSMQELSSTVTQNADNARQANDLATSAHSVATKGGEIMTNVITRMSSIADHSLKISDIVSMIESIAFQTNILALNAAVEAARAGEQGKGFAVVAGEVRSLASRSAEAAKEIKVLIDTATRDVADGNKLVEAAGETMDEIVASVNRVAGIMSEISAASIEQSRGIAQINQAVSQMDDVTHRNALLVHETTQTVGQLKTSVMRVSDAIAILRTGESQMEIFAEDRPKTAPVQTAEIAPVEEAVDEAQPASSAQPVAKSRVRGAAKAKAEPVQQEIVSPLKKNSSSNEGDWDSF